MQMDNTFSRVKSIIDRLRDVLKCQICSQMKKEDLMLFYHVCDHFYCTDCISKDKICPLCKNPLDKPTDVVSDKNILSLYQSLAKFELPSKQDVENIYKTHIESKEEKLKENQGSGEPDGVLETPKNQAKSRLHLRERRKSNLISPEGAGTVIVSSGEDSGFLAKGVPSKNQSTSSRGRKTSTPSRKVGGISATSTPIGRGRSATPVVKGKQEKTPSTSITGSSKGNVSLNKSNINKRNPKGETQLHLACKKSNFKTMAELIAAGANPNAQDNAGWTPLNILYKMAENHGVSEMDLKIEVGFFLLQHDSVFSGNIEVIKFLLDNGARVNAPGLENTTALHEAIAKGNVKIVKLLLEYGADVNAMNIFKETPLDLITKYKLEEMKEVLSEVSSSAIKPTAVVEDADEKLIICKHNLSIEDEKLVNKFVEKFDGELISSLMSKTPPSHIIIPDEKVEMSWALISAVPNGCWVVTPDWVTNSLKENSPRPAADYETKSPLFSGFSKARKNKQNQHPGLFSGCHFFFGGNFDQYTIKNLTIGKEELKIFVEKNGGAIVKRCPDPESLALEKTVPFHAPADSSLRETSYFIVYQTEKWDPKPKYNMSHMKTLPVEWLVCCVLKFELIDPKESSWSDVL